MPRRSPDPDIFLSVDPSSTSTGICLWVRKWPVLTLSVKPVDKSPVERLARILHHIQLLGEQKRVSGLAYEQQAFNPKRPAPHLQTLARSLKALAEENGWWARAYTNTQIKSLLDPQRAYTMKQYKLAIATKVERLFGVSAITKSSDELDAIGVGWAHLLATRERKL